jgi:6-phosphogluconolactonase (cycloisomerase 2 family)
MKPTSSSSREVEFEKLLAEAEESMRQRRQDDNGAPKSHDTHDTKDAHGLSAGQESKMEIPCEVVRDSTLKQDIRARGRFWQGLSSRGRFPVFRDLSVLIVTIIAVAVCASCIQNLTLTPLTASVATSQSATFTANFTRNGGNNLKTSWTLTQGNSSQSCAPGCGTLSLSSSGTTYTAIYTAPAAVPTPSSVILTFVASDTDGTKSAFATITVIPGSNALTITPQSQTVIAGSTTTQQFTANQSGSPATGITWALTQGGSSCLPAVCGSLASATANPAIYTPPTTFSASGTVTLTATQASSSQAPSATITVQPATLQSIAVTPTGPSIQVGQTQPFTATGTYTNAQQQALTTGVTWASSDMTVASIDSTGAALGLKAGSTFITATQGSVGSPTKGATLTVTPAPVSNVPRYLFEINGDSTISTYAVVPSTGQLRSVTYLSTAATVGLTTTAALNPNGNVLYAAESVPAGQQLTTYSISAGGVLSQAASSMNAEGTFGQLLADPLGRFLWVADNSTGQILSYALDSTTGVPGTQTIAASVANVEVIAADPTGTYLFSEDISGNVAAYTVASGGMLAPLGTPPPSHPFGHDTMIVDPAGQYLYVMDDNSINSLYGYTISGTGLTSISGSPFNVPNNAGVDMQMAIDPSSSFLYAVDISNSSQPIDAFTIGTGGALTSLSETIQSPPSGNASRITIDPSGKYAFVAYGNVREVWTYSIAQAGASRGTLTPVNRMRLRSSNIFDAQLLSSGSAPVAFTPQALYVTNSISNSVSQFSIDPSTGTLTSLGPPFTGGSGAAIGTQPQGLAVQPNDNLLYVGDFASAEIDSFSVTTNGVLSSSGLQPVVVPGETPASLTIDLSGSFLYIADQIGGNIGELSVGSAGALGPLPTTTSSVTGSAPVFVTTEPSGQFIYAANSGPGSISTYSISLPSGALSSVASSVFVSAGTGTDWIVADPSGRFLYSTAFNSNSLQEFLITAGTGLPTVNTNPFLPVGPSAANPGASSVVIEPTGKFVYATNKSLNQIFAFSIDPTTGLLSEIHTNNADSEVADTGTTPVALAVDISGQYLYCLNSGSNDINIYKINLADGTLTAVGTGTVPTGGTTPTMLVVTGTLQ